MQLCSQGTYPKKTVFKVSNRNTRKRCLQVSKKILKTSERSQLTTSYLPEVTLQNHVLDRFSQNIYQFEIKSDDPQFQQRYLMRNDELSLKYLIHEKFKMSAFLVSEKTAPKWTKFSTFYLIFKDYARHFCIAKLDILMFCNILHFGLGFGLGF